MADGTIVVRFEESSSESSNKPKEKVTSNSSGKKGSKKETEDEISKSAIAQSVQGVAKQLISNGISKIGDLTGDYVAQNGINNMIQAASMVGAIANFPVGTITAVGTITTNIINNSIANTKANRQSSMLSKRAGTEAIRRRQGLA